MDNLQDTKTYNNLISAFEGESQARNKYTYFASVARKEGYEQIAGIFDMTADNEKEHAKIWFKLIDGIGTTKENLLSAAKGEMQEHTRMYPEMAKQARQEGFEHIAKLFEGVAEVEQYHEMRYRKLIENLESDRVFAKDIEMTWICTNCGHHHIGTDAPSVCPVCAHPKAYFEINCDNY